MPVVVTPVETIVLSVDATNQVECQVTAHNIQDADVGGGETIRTGCGDVVNIPADDVNVGTIDLTLFPERGDTKFLQWTWIHAGETVAFEFTVNPGTPEGLKWSGEVTMPAMPEKQDEYGKKETTDVTWNVTKWIDRAVSAATP